ncbi:hypothetical protein PGTUg99_024795 [Puccinia graminis f. sp. tritici]|uniref:Uncharacterized protein n=1 Tax=Puccinia graminis f. sp. tritici TaxID=56615 RepID=A0A5B0S0V2_PUCGR|nr:hypothetical protein PGTUg99_024795 [Puccinia graminis f. sp. tritici]
MHHALFSVVFVFLFASITAREYYPKGSTWLLMKGMDAPIQDSLKLPAAAPDSTSNPSVHPTAEDSNTQPDATVPVEANNTSSDRTKADPTHPRNITTPPTEPPASNHNSTAPANNNGPPTSLPDVPAPEQTVNSTCHNSSTGKNVTFSDRACWYAAKALAEAGSSYAQCGTCVLGLFDADKKVAFKPPSSIPAPIVQEQAMKLLHECKGSLSKVSKRDTAPSSASNNTANVQLLMGFNEKPKDCPGL